MIHKLVLALTAATLMALAPVAAAEGPSLWERYLHRIADQAPTRIEPNTFSAIPKGRSARYYSCGDSYCDSGSYCCTYSLGSYCCPGYSQCGGDGYCY